MLAQRGVFVASFDAMEQFGKVDILVNNAGNFFAFQLYKGFL